MRLENSNLRTTWALCIVTLCCVLSIAVVSTAQAAFYKCVGDDGSTTYNDVPCAADESTHLLSKSARQLEVLDCRIARNFAFDAVARMRQDDSAAEVFDAYGGADSLSDDARNLVNYVYSFKNNQLTSAQRIVNLTIDRCQAGLLGQALDQCQSFPELFIDKFGSCIGARQSEQTVLIQSLGSDDLSQNATDDGQIKDTPTLKAARPVTETLQKPSGAQQLSAPQPRQAQTKR